MVFLKRFWLYLTIAAVITGLSQFTALSYAVSENHVRPDDDMADTNAPENLPDDPAGRTGEPMTDRFSAAASKLIREPVTERLTPEPDQEEIYIGPLPEYDNADDSPWVDATPYLVDKGLVSTTPIMDPGPTRTGRDGVGDQKQLWALNYANSRWRRYDATCRSVGDNSYIYVQNGINYNQAKIDWLEDQFNNTIYPIDTKVFGPPPDVDGVRQVTIFLYNIDGGGRTGGYFTSINEVNNPNDPWYPYSNHREMFYIDHADLNSWGQHIAAHELQHVIHFNGDANENTWVDEGCADLAIMKCYGYVSAVAGHVNNFRSHPDKDLTAWGGNGYDYGASVAFINYMEEHFGGEEMIRDLVDENFNSISGVNTILAAYGYQERFTDVFKNWTVANKLDDPSVAGGVYNHQNISLRIPDTASYNGTHYPLGKTNRNVNHWAADYYRFTDGIGMLEFSFNGVDSARFAIMVIKQGTGGTVVEELNLDSNQDGDFGILGLGPTYDDMVIVVACINSGTGTASYSFSADTSNRPVIIHEPWEDNNLIDGPHEIRATIVDPDFNLNTSSLRLHYNKDGTQVYNEINLTNVGGDEYSADIPGPSNGVEIFYYLSAADEDLNVTTHPFEADPLDNTTVHSFLVVPDVTPPEIVHSPLKDTVFTGPFEIYARVTDDWSLDTDSIKLHFNRSSVPNFVEVQMERTASPDEYRAVIPKCGAGERINYYLTARDTYQFPNSGRLPLTDYYSFIVFEPATILLVDDDRAGNYTHFDRWYRDALNYTNYPYDVYNVPESQDGPNSTILNRYDTVIWETGDEWGNYMSEPESGRTLTNQDIDEISYFLDQGGNLLLSGSFIGLELRWDSFFTKYMYIKYEGAYNYTGLQDIDGVPGNRISGDLPISLINRSSDSSQRYMCNYSSIGSGSETIFRSADHNASVGFRIAGENYKAVYLSFAFEELSDNVTRNILMARILEYLIPCMSVSHDPLGNSVDTTNPYPVEMTAHSDSNVESAKVIYSTDGIDRHTVPMVYSAQKGTFSCEIPPQPGDTTVLYHIEAQNRYKCRGFHPLNVNPRDVGTWHEFTVFTSDTEPPILFHEPKYDVLYIENYTFLATAVDNVRIDVSTFGLEYAFHDPVQGDRTMRSNFTEISPGTFTTTAHGPPGIIYYRITVDDVVGNSATFPSEGFFDMNVFFHDNLEMDTGNWSFPGSQNPWTMAEMDSTTFPPLSISGNNFPNSHILTTGIDSNYSQGVDARVITPEIDLTRAHDTELSFYMWANLTPFNNTGPLDEDFDEIIIEARDKTEGYTTLAVFNHTTLPNENEWAQIKLDISSVSGKVINLCWRIIDKDPGAQARGVALDFIRITGDFNNTPPEFISYSLTPQSGFNNTMFMFNATYRDADNDPPEVVYLVLDNHTSYLPMAARDDWDDDVRDGKNYTIQVSLPAGEHTCYFNTRNLFDNVSTPAISGPEVFGANSPPVLSLPDLEVIAGHELVHRVSAVDMDNDTHTFSDNTTMFDIDSATGEFAVIPSLDDVGVHLVWVGVSDGFFEVWGSFNITVLNNLPPVITEPGNLTAYMEQEFNHTIRATDAENDTLTYSIKTKLFDVNESIGEIGFIPSRKDIGVHHLTVFVDDGINEPVSLNFELVILLVNTPPELLNMSVTPNGGNDSIRYVFTAVYYDRDNDDMEYVRVYIDNESFDMIEVDDDAFFFPIGDVYQYKSKLTPGNHSFYFECMDGSDTENAVFKSEVYHVMVNKTGKQDTGDDPTENENILGKHARWLVLGGLCLVLIIIVYFMVSASRKKKKKEEKKELLKKISDTMKCPVCKAEMGKYETVCPSCDHRIGKRKNIYKKKEDKEKTRTCPGCYSSVNVKDVRCPFCKIRLGSGRGKKKKRPAAKRVQKNVVKEGLSDYKIPAKKTRKRIRKVKKKETVGGDEELESDLIFKKPGDYSEKEEGDIPQEDGVEVMDDFERELEKIVESGGQDDGTDPDGEFVSEEKHIWEDDDDDNDEDSYEDSNEDDEFGDIVIEPGIGSGGIWDHDEDDGGSDGEDEEKEYLPEESESAGQGIWDDEEEDGEVPVDDGDEEIQEEERDEVDMEPKSFQWVDNDDDDDDDNEESNMGEEEGGEDELAAEKGIWDEDDGELEISDVFVLMDEDEDDERRYRETEFDILESYEEAGEGVATWDDDESESFFEIIEEARDSEKKTIGKKKKMQKKKRKKKDSEKKVVFIPEDEDMGTASWDD